MSSAVNSIGPAQAAVQAERVAKVAEVKADAAPKVTAPKPSTVVFDPALAKKNLTEAVGLLNQQSIVGMARNTHDFQPTGQMIHHIEAIHPDISGRSNNSDFFGKRGRATQRKTGPRAARIRCTSRKWPVPITLLFGRNRHAGLRWSLHPCSPRAACLALRLAILVPAHQQRQDRCLLTENHTGLGQAQAYPGSCRACPDAC